MTSRNHSRKAKAENKAPEAQNDPEKAAGEGLTEPSQSAADRAAEDMLEALLAFDDAEEEEADEISSALEDLLAPKPAREIEETPPPQTPDEDKPIAVEEPETAEPTPQDRPAPKKSEEKVQKQPSEPEPAPRSPKTAPPPAVRSKPNPPARRKKKQNLPDKPRQKPPARRAQGDLDRVLRVGPVTTPSRSSWFRRIFWLTVLGLLIFGLTRPYSMEVGGEFFIQPLDRAEVRARTDGEITQVNVEEGDWVEAEEILAVLSNWDEKRDVAVRLAEISRLEAELETLIEGPKPSEIAVAQQRVDTALIQLEIAATALERQEQLMEAGVISDSRVEDARANHRLAQAKVAEQRSNLELVSEEATPLEITSAKAEISRNLEDLKFAELKLEQTYIRAPVSGQVVSTMTEVPIGTYLPEGGLFAELEDNRTVLAMIEVPETLIEDVSIGASVEMRLWSDTSTSVYGTVKRLAPRAEEREFGRVVRVNVEVPNPDGKLNGNMTGHAKVDAGVFPAWVVFTRLIVRFFNVEVWSWVP